MTSTAPISGTAIVLRTPSGISGDMLLTGLARLAGVSNAELSAIVDSIGLDALRDCVTIEDTHVEWITGSRATINLPHEHHHRTLKSILDIIAASTLELSNVDLTDEFVDMITTQRAYQANSKTITTSDEMLETAINMKR